MIGLKTWWEDGPDLYHFLMTQEQNKLKVIPELAVINQLTGQLIMFRFQSNKDGITVY
jgi:hypothetical protein